MKTQKEIFTWLKANCGKHCIAPLGSQDVFALVTSVNLTNMITWKGAEPELFAAYGAIVRQMQPHLRYLAFHAIAMGLDWSHRYMIWELAELPEGDKPAHKAAWEPGGSAVTYAPKESIIRPNDPPIRIHNANPDHPLAC
jgi:hypothetical protein